MKYLATLDMKTYYIDFCISTLLFIILFILGSINPFFYILSSICLYRAGAFTHEIAHQYHRREFKLFRFIWTYTIGILLIQHPLRFTKPHLKHHKVGIFGTKQDPQYPLVRSNIWIWILVFIISPIGLPIFNFIISILSLFNIHESKFHNILYKNITYSTQEKKEMNVTDKIYTGVIVLGFVLNPTLICKLALVIIGSWWLATLRIPLEHELKAYKETSNREDQRLDSKTHLSPIYIIVQPLALRFHTAHHLYPGVPYHNLEDLHYKLRYQ